MELGLFQQQTMKLAMTQQLRQAITLLQYSSQELVEFIQEQALENPLMDLEEPAADHSRVSSAFDSGSYRTRTSRKDDAYNPFDHICDEIQNPLKEDILQQARYLNLAAETYKIVEYLADLLDDDGYLPENVIAETAVALHRSTEKVENALVMLQKLEPAGIGARNLKECLVIQIRQKAPEDDLAQAMVATYLPQVAEKNWRMVAEACEVSIGEVEDAAAFITALQPRPGSMYATEEPTLTRPDLTIEEAGEAFVVLLHDDFMPAIRRNHQYDTLLADQSQNDASRYIHHKNQQLKWLMKSIEQRRITLTRVTEAIAKKQIQFLRRGSHFLVPLTLRDIAEELGIHESTVSRAIRQKTVQTPAGLFELKSFFASRVNTVSGEDLSSASVKALIRDMITKENQSKPLSDQKIADELETTEGITLSRRTVAKYREEQQIPSSGKRKAYQV